MQETQVSSHWGGRSLSAVRQHRRVLVGLKDRIKRARVDYHRSLSPAPAPAAAAPLVESTVAGSNEQQARQPAPNTGEADSLVLVWDLDETLLIFNALQTGAWAAAHPGTDLAALRRLGGQWRAAILDAADQHLLFTQVEEFDVGSLAAISGFDDGASLQGYDFDQDGFPAGALLQQRQQHAQRHREEQQQHTQRQPRMKQQQLEKDGKEEDGDANEEEEQLGPLEISITSLDAANQRHLARRYRQISAAYVKGLDSMGTQRVRQRWQQLFAQTDLLTGGWLSHAAQLLKDCTSLPASSGSMPVHHVVVTSGQLVPSLAKLLLFRLSALFQPGDVYSSRGSTKAACFDLVERRFGPGCRYAAIGAQAGCWCPVQHARWTGGDLWLVGLARLPKKPQRTCASDPVAHTHVAACGASTPDPTQQAPPPHPPYGC